LQVERASPKQVVLREQVLNVHKLVIRILLGLDSDVGIAAEFVDLEELGGGLLQGLWVHHLPGWLLEDGLLQLPRCGLFL